jgi:hypothetical protein
MKTGLAILAIVAVLSGCTHAPQKTDASATTETPAQLWPNWPSLLNDFRFQWTAEPGIDITIGPAMVARAYLEASDVATFTLNPDNVYPGFNRATPENEKATGNFEYQLTHIRPLGEAYTETAKDATPHFGHVTYHFLDLKPVDDGWDAIVCDGFYAHFLQSKAQPGKYVSVAALQETAQPRPGESNSLDSGVVPVRIHFTQHDPRVGSSSPAPISVPQKGPAPAPNVDVFGDWFITGSSSRGWGPQRNPQSREWPSPELERQCGEAMPQNEAERLAMITGFKDAPPPHGDAVPGWPLDSK